jgi:lambda family phage portal protein
MAGGGSVARKGGKPGARAQREATRAGRVQVPLAHYDAAGTGRRMASWRPASSGPNAANSAMPTIRNRQRDAERNEWQAASGVRVWSTNLIGTGIQARQTAGSEELRARAKRYWDEWTPQCDADGVLNFNGQQLLGTRCLTGVGEVFVRFRPRRPDDGLAVPFQVQLLESDMVPMLDADVWPGLPSGNRIRQGIELNRINQRAAYWMYRSHPGERAGAARAGELVRVPARFVRHVFEPTRPGQLRGVSEFAPVIAKLRSVGNFDDAVLHRQELSNLFTLFHIRPAPGGDPALNPITGMAVAGYADNGAPLATLEPGISQELYPGEDVKFSDPPDAGANYAEFMRQQHLGLSGGGGLPYELMTGDIKDVSDRTLRVVINEFRRRCEQRQWLTIIPMMCQPIRDFWAESAALAGIFTAAEVPLVKKVAWQPQGWAYIHPTQDAQGKKIEVDAGFRSRESVITERGDDPDEVDAQIARDRFAERTKPPRNKKAA